MLISSAMNEALNEQIGNEFGASLQYISIAAYFNTESLPELARHFFAQASEERDHAMRFVKYVLDAGGQVQIPTIPAPQSGFPSAESAVQLSLDSELRVTQQINALADLAIKESDHITGNTLQWFINEQLEEVSSMETLLHMIQRAGESGLLFIESHLARNSRGVTLVPESTAP